MWPTSYWPSSLCIYMHILLEFCTIHSMEAYSNHICNAIFHIRMHTHSQYWMFCEYFSLSQMTNRRKENITFALFHINSMSMGVIFIFLLQSFVVRLIFKVSDDGSQRESKSDLLLVLLLFFGYPEKWNDDIKYKFLLRF